MGVHFANVSCRQLLVKHSRTTRAGYVCICVNTPGIFRLAVLLTCGEVVVFAQTAAATGRIVDPQGKAVVGARVKIARHNGSSVAETQTDSVGQYLFRSIQAGEYHSGPASRLRHC